MREPIDPPDPVAVRARLDAHRDAQDRLVRLEIIALAIPGAIIVAALAARIMDLVGS